MLIRQGEFIGRRQFGEYLRLKYPGEPGVEIGTHRGEFASWLLERWSPKPLFCIDPYLTDYDEHDDAICTRTAEQRQEDMSEARRVLHQHKQIDGHDMVGFMCMTSRKAIKHFQDGSLAFVYVDGSHRLEEVCFDVCEWWKKVKPGGILAGHDFTNSSRRIAVNVQSAVRQLADQEAVEVFVVPETCVNPPEPWSFYLVKR